ncbi:MAG: hypothetical protein ABW156_02945 [Jiangellaceae bacterium]
MSANHVELRKHVTGRRVGYAIAAAVNVVILYLLNGSPGWAALPFLTGEMTQVLPLVNVALAVGVAVNVIQALYDPVWLVAAGSAITTGIGLAVIIRIWQVFPFDLGSGWSIVFRVLLVVALVGSIIGLVVNLVTLTRAALRGPTRELNPRR